MKKILVFGTGGAAQKLMENGGDIYDITGFLDNDKKKHGQLFHGRRIYPPAEIQHLEYEQIIIASMWFSDIKAQLMEQFGIPETMIRAIPKIFTSAGKRYRPFEDEDTRSYAARVLQHVCPFLEEQGIPCYVDHGTLIGLVRDDCIMPWDDDIDLSVADTDREKLYAVIPALMAAMPDSDRMRWKTELIYNSIDDVIALFLTVEDRLEKRHPFNAGISFFTFQNGLAIEAINWAPAGHYAGGEWIDTSLGKFRAPNGPEEYLTLHYGQWKTPVKDMAFGQIDNFKRREAPAQWIAWDYQQLPSPAGLIEEQAKGRIHATRLFIVASIENPNGGPRIPLSLPTLKTSLGTLASFFKTDVAVIAGADPATEQALLEIMDAVIHSGIADAVNIEVGLHETLSETVEKTMDRLGVKRSFHRSSFQHRENPPIFSDPSCTDIMRGAIKQFRCRYKTRLLLWNNLLAHCPMALSIHQTGATEAVAPDIVALEPPHPDIKQQVLTMLRHRPCSPHAQCSSDDHVWEPYATYHFSRSTPEPTTGDHDD